MHDWPWDESDIGSQGTAGRHYCTCMGEATPSHSTPTGQHFHFLDITEPDRGSCGAQQAHGPAAGRLLTLQSCALQVWYVWCRLQDLCWQVGSLLHVKGSAHSSRRCHMHARMEGRLVRAASLAQAYLTGSYLWPH